VHLESERARARYPLAKLNFKGSFDLKTDLRAGYDVCTSKKFIARAYAGMQDALIAGVP